MGNKPNHQPKETRVNNLHEVSLGYGKKIAQDEARRCPQCAQPTCLSGCPLGIDIPGFIRFLREGDAVSALAKIKLSNPFPAICGRICPAPCENACIFYQEGDPIGIRALERYAADNGVVKNEKKTPITFKGIKVAIIGSGPSGLAAAYSLALQGYGVTIFESMAQAGGLMRYGVPEFRLSQKILDEQIEEVKSLGVEIRTDVFVGKTLSVSEIFMQGFGALLLAVGAALPDFADIKGENLGGVYYAEEFLMRLHDRRKDDVFIPAGTLMQGMQTIVIGGGSSAVDCARMAVRLGQKVRLVFPGLEEQMEVYKDDLKAAIDEGVIFDAAVEPLAIVGNEQNFASAVQCRRLEIIERDTGFLLQPLANSDFDLQADTVILAHGRTPNTFLKQHLPQLRWTDQGALWIDAVSGQTSVDKIFACGNVTTGAGPVVDAIASGKLAAEKIAGYLTK